MESTRNDLDVGNLHNVGMLDVSTISSVSTQGETWSGSGQHQLKVYLRVRPFSKEEMANNENQDCVIIESAQTIVLQAPRGSATLKSSERGIGQAVHKFTFSQIFGPEVDQVNFFESTIKTKVSDYLEGKNVLIFTYGVTSAGKTHTIQGSHKDPGLLPRTLDMIFKGIKRKQYDQMNLKPYLSSDVQFLDPEQVKWEKSEKVALLSLLKEEDDHNLNSDGNSASASTSSASSLSLASLSDDKTADSTDTTSERFSMWVSYYEIYNEAVYDLLQPIQSSKNKKRSALRVCDDSTGNSYVRGLKCINVQNTEEAWRILKIGNKHRSAASTKLNQSSSRSHSIFTIKLLKINGCEVQRMSELSLCDLAGSERCNKTQTFGERLKEAGRINNSLLILGKCIAALRHNQSDRIKNYIPFRESKLTRLFQSVFCGKGQACMIVNINQCASTYDETLHVLKFAAVAKQVVQVFPTKPLEHLAPRLVGRDGKPLVKNGVIDGEALESFLTEEELLDEEDEAEMSILPQEDLLNVIESLKEKLLAERRRNLVQEMEIRKEMGDAMLKELMESEELRSQQMAELKESYEEKLENTFELYKDALKDHAYQCALERIEEEYVHVDEFFAEQQKAEELKRKLVEVENRLQCYAECPVVVTLERATQCSPEPQETAVADSQKYQMLYDEKCAAENLCEKRDQMICSLEKKIVVLSETLQEAGESFMEKAAEIEGLQKSLAEKNLEIDRLQRDLSAKDALVSSLSDELATLSKGRPSQSKPRRGLLANIKESVTSPRKGALSRTLKSVRVASTTKKKPS
ncbi:hypothetical protein GJAV_G00078100 [Gymnothorax javanicus]|nr:hypothetical protein GJAV_G00078100 [Gymnothorax javanicus]